MGSGCEEAVRLQALYRNALAAVDAYSGISPDPAKRIAGTPEQIREASSALVTARRRYWTHVQRHRCRGKAADSDVVFTEDQAEELRQLRAATNVYRAVVERMLREASGEPEQDVSL